MIRLVDFLTESGHVWLASTRKEQMVNGIVDVFDPASPHRNDRQLGIVCVLRRRQLRALT